MKSGAKEIIVLGRKVVEGFKCCHSGSGANREQSVDLTGRSTVHKQSKGLGFWILESLHARLAVGLSLSLKTTALEGDTGDGGNGDCHDEQARRAGVAACL
jgi:hypothetical protein